MYAGVVIDHHYCEVRKRHKNGSHFLGIGRLDIRRRCQREYGSRAGPSADLEEIDSHKCST